MRVQSHNYHTQAIIHSSDNALDCRRGTRGGYGACVSDNSRVAKSVGHPLHEEFDGEDPPWRRCEGYESQSERVGEETEHETVSISYLLQNFTYDKDRNRLK